MLKIKNRYEAETLFCELVVEAGFAAGVSAYGGNQSSHVSQQLSVDTVSAIHQCEFSDPHFIGGPAIFNFAKSVEDVDRIFERAEPVITELATALSYLDSGRANQFRADILAIRNWMSHTF